MNNSAYLVDPPAPDAREPRPSFDVSSGTLPPGAKEAYDADGVVCLRRIVGEDRVGHVWAGCEEAERNPGPHSNRVGGADGGPSFFWDINVSTRIPAFHDLLHNSSVIDLSMQVMGAETLGFYFDNLFVKDGLGGAPTPYHEDATYQRIHGTHAVNLWIALDSIPAATALQFLAGSHKRESPVFLMNTHFDAERAYEQPISRDRIAMPPVDELALQFETIWWELEPGDALIWNQRTIHAAPGNTIDRQRRAISYIFTGDDAYYNAAPGTTDPNISDATLVEGAPIRSDVFPALR